MTKLTDTRVEVTDETDCRRVVFETTEGEVQFIDMGDEPTVEVGWSPATVTEAASILGDVAEDIGTEAVQLACEILADIDEESMFEFFETEDQVVLADADGLIVLDEEEAEEYREVQR